MASITRQKNGGFQIQFVGIDKRRRSVRLGKIKPKSAELIKLRIEQLVAAQKAGVRNDPELTQWLEGIADQLHGKLARVELIPPRKAKQVIALRAFLEGYKKRRNDVKPATYEVWRQPMRNLVEFFGATRDITTITEAEALDFRQLLVGSELATTTVSKRLQFVRSFFNDARRRKLIKENPFAEVSSKSVVRLDQRHFVTKAETEKLLDSCPNHHWRTIISLARYGGLRCPSEVLSLRWQDINWDKKRIAVQSPKTEGQGKESRVIPLFPELKTVLDEAWEMAPEGAVYVVDERHRRAANRKTGWKNCNLRTTFLKIISRAGLQPWPKVFHAMRSSRETELANEYPIHVVTAWLGNTPSIALRHYLLTTADDFDRAATAQATTPEPAQESANEPTDNAVQKAVQNGAETGRNTGQGQSGTCRNTKENGRLHGIATCRGGGHGGLSSQFGFAQQNATKVAIPRAKPQLPASESSCLIPSDPVFGGHQQGQNRAKKSTGISLRLLAFLAITVCLIGMAIVSENSTEVDDSSSEQIIVPNAKRERIVPKQDRGLPPQETLEEFAKLYIEYVTQLWPELKAKGLLPTDCPETITEMVENYKNRHRNGYVDVEHLRHIGGFVEKLGVMYPRYSDPKSQAKSISDQAFQIVQKARREDCFIPWELVFADYARSATRGHRQGFESMIKVLKENGTDIDVVMIDDFQRGSRNDRQWWQFAGTCKNEEIELYCGSDGFNLQDENWEEMLTLYNLITRLEGKFRQMRVRRGLRGAAQRHRVHGKLSLGFARTPEIDAEGNQVTKPDGKPFMVPCIHPEERKFREKMYELFTVKKWSYYKIAQYFNRAQIGGWSGWVDTGIRSTLTNPDAIGVFIFNRTFLEKDHVDGEWKRKPNLRSEWDVYYDPSLAIISIETWRATKKRVAEISQAYVKRDAQAGRTASTLFSKTLVCGYCGKTLTLGRSANGGKYKQFQCANGKRRRHSCCLTTTKSVTIIEKCLLQFLSDAILTEENLRRIFTQANELLATEADRPKVDVGPLKTALARRQREKDKLFARIAKTDDLNLCDAYDAQIAKLEKEVKAFRQQLRDAEIKNVDPPPPIDLSDLGRHLANIRVLLNQEIPAAAEALYALMGPVSITQVKKPGRKSGGTWIAKFTPQLVQFLSQLAHDLDYPECRTMEFLSRGKWITAKQHKVLLDQVPPKLSEAPKLAARFQAGETVDELAGSIGLTTERTRELVDYALNGNRPKSAKEKKAQLIREIQVDVVRLRDEENRSFSEIERWFANERKQQVPRSWIIGAWDNAHPEEIAAAKAEDRRPRRGRFCHHSTEKIGQIREHLKAGRFNLAEIARLTGVCEMTVRRQRDMMNVGQKRKKKAG